MAPILADTDFTRLFKLHTDACKSSVRACCTRLMMMARMLSLLMPVGVRQRPNLTTLPISWNFSPWAIVKKFHEYLYGPAFDVYTDNNPLTYDLTMAKLDAASHHWVASLANTIFSCIKGQGRPISMEMPCQECPGWGACLILQTHIQVTAVAVWAMQEAALKGSTSPIKAYSSNVHVLDKVGDSQQVTCMTTDDWHQTDPVLVSLQGYKKGLWANTSSRQLILPNCNSSLGSATTSSWWEAFSIGRHSPGNPKRLYSSWSCWLHTGRLL